MNTMKGVWAVGNQKGGVGKSTLAVNLAAMAVKNRIKACVYDVDPAHSVREWATVRSVQTDILKVDVVVADALVYDKPGAMKSDIERLRQDYELIVIDVAGALNEATRRAFHLADLIFVPVEPGPIVQVDQTFAFITEMGRPVPLLMAYNKVRPGGDAFLKQIIQEQNKEEEWKTKYGVTVLGTQIYLRTAWKWTFEFGLAVFEGVGERYDEKAIGDLKALYSEISGLFASYKAQQMAAV